MSAPAGHRDDSRLPGPAAPRPAGDEGGRGHGVPGRTPGDVLERISGNVSGSRPGAARYVVPGLALVGLVALLFGSVVVATAIGSVPVPYGETARIVLTKAFGLPWAGNGTHEAIIWSVRMPRVLVAGLIGLGLGVSGAAMQGLFKNPLASPDLLGVSAGGAVGAAAAILAGWAFVHPWIVPGVAFVGALAAVSVVYVLGTRAGRTDIASLLLAGVAVGAFGSAIVSLMYHFVDDGVLRQIVFWLMGNLSGRRWEHVAVLTPFVLVSGVGLWLLSAELNVLMGGQDDARAMGVPVERTKRWVLVLVSLGTGAAVSVAGIIGFLGLI